MRNPVRAGGAICDISLQVKKILDEIEGVTLQVIVNAHTGA